MVFTALLAVLEQDLWRVLAVDRGRNQEVWCIAAETLETGLSVIIDYFDEVSALLFCWVEVSGSWDWGSPT